MRCCKKISLWGGILLGLFLATAACAEGIEIKNAELEAVEDNLLLKADIDINLGQTLEDALNKGVPLNFVAEFELKRPRWYWLDETVSTAQQHVRLSYHALTRQYQLNFNNQQRSYLMLDDARRELGRLRDWPVAKRTQVKDKQAYVAGLRFRLDVGQLPKPLQINALASKDWNLDSNWHYWNFPS
jgi:hypothetical protein